MRKILTHAALVELAPILFLGQQAALSVRRVLILMLLELILLRHALNAQPVLSQIIRDLLIVSNVILEHILFLDQLAVLGVQRALILKFLELILLHHAFNAQPVLTLISRNRRRSLTVMNAILVPILFLDHQAVLSVRLVLILMFLEPSQHLLALLVLPALMHRIQGILNALHVSLATTPAQDL